MPLAASSPLITQTVERILPFVPPERIRVLTGDALAGPILAAAPALNRDHLLLEPRARGTAPVLAWAAHTLAAADPRAVMLSLHSDHVIEPADAFRDTLARAAALCVRHQRLFTLGAQPTRAETGYGYIRPGAALGEDEDARAVERFVEKPDRETAARYVADGYLWNTGIFIWPAALLLEEIRLHTPEVAEVLPLLDRGDVAGFFERVPTLTVDVGVLERSDRVAVLRTTFRWDDVGGWDAVGRNRESDARGNVAVGDVQLVDTDNCIAWSEDGSVVVFGAQDLVVVRTRGITFVAPRAHTPDLKRLLAQLPEHLVHGDE